MKHWGFTAAEFIGWSRVCRPGSVIGPQQQYLAEIESRMWAEGEAFRRRRAEAYVGGAVALSSLCMRLMVTMLLWCGSTLTSAGAKLRRKMMRPP